MAERPIRPLTQNRFDGIMWEDAGRAVVILARRNNESGTKNRLPSGLIAHVASFLAPEHDEKDNILAYNAANAREKANLLLRPSPQ